MSYLTKWLLTFWARVCLHSTVSEHVSFQICSSTKWLLALDKSVCSFFAVGDHVSLQMSYLTKWLLAFWASVGFSPLWMSICVFKVPARPNNFLHSEQICIFSPLWVSICWFRCPAEPNDFLHWTQLNILSLLWVSIRLFRISGQPNDFWHPAQLCIFFLRCRFLLALTCNNQCKLISRVDNSSADVQTLHQNSLIADNLHISTLIFFTYYGLLYFIIQGVSYLPNNKL